MFQNAKGLAGQVIGRVGAFPVKRSSADRSAIKRAASMLKRGELVGIFPEGTRRGRGSAVPELHSGVAFIARMGKAAIIPSSVRRVDETKPKGSTFVRFPALRWHSASRCTWKISIFFPKKTGSTQHRGMS